MSNLIENGLRIPNSLSFRSSGPGTLEKTEVSLEDHSLVESRAYTAALWTSISNLASVFANALPTSLTSLRFPKSTTKDFKRPESLRLGNISFIFSIPSSAFAAVRAPTYVLAPRRARKTAILNPRPVGELINIQTHAH